ncbi:MAG: CaiB/BaiF CoA transferase family protein [Hyphomicrobiaceae bacterium]
MGPLRGLRIVEMAGIGPAPFCAMLLADMGAEVIRVDRREAIDLGVPRHDPKFDLLLRGRRSLAVDLKSERGCAVVRKLAARADAVIEGFRPGVMERLGLGPEVLQKDNPKLVFGRMTGWGQDGPMAPRAGHDINYIALSGVLHAIGRAGGPPVPPLNLVGDFGGGAMFLAFGVVCAMLEAQRSGKGQVVDASMVDGAAYLLTAMYGLFAQGIWRDERGTNILDTGAPWYDVYETKDGKWLSVGAIEKRFYDEFIAKLGLDAAALPLQHDRNRWPQLRRIFEETIRGRTRAEWETVFAGSDACVAPVLGLGEVADNAHNAARSTFIRQDGVLQPAPAPRFSRTAASPGAPPAPRGRDSAEVLADWGLPADEIAALSRDGVIGAASR